MNRLTNLIYKIFIYLNVIQLKQIYDPTQTVHAFIIIGFMNTHILTNNYIYITKKYILPTFSKKKKEKNIYITPRNKNIYILLMERSQPSINVGSRILASYVRSCARMKRPRIKGVFSSETGPWAQPASLYMSAHFFILLHPRCSVSQFALSSE